MAYGLQLGLAQLAELVDGHLWSEDARSEARHEDLHVANILDCVQAIAQHFVLGRLANTHLVTLAKGCAEGAEDLLACPPRRAGLLDIKWQRGGIENLLLGFPNLLDVFG